MGKSTSQTSPGPSGNESRGPAILRTSGGGSVDCPLIVLHGFGDTIVEPVDAHHTATLLRNARLLVVDDLGHVSMVAEVFLTLIDLTDR